MAKIQEVAGLISETLQLDPMFVQNHVDGLTEAGCIEGGQIEAAETAQLLCACLSTDKRNATGPFNLHFVGAATSDTSLPWIEVGSEYFEYLNGVFPDFGSAVASLIGMSAEGTVPPDVTETIHVSGSGNRLRAFMTIKATIGGQPNSLTVWFGYDPLFQLVQKIAQRPAYIETANEIGPQVIDRLGALLRVQNTESSVIKLSEYRRELH